MTIACSVCGRACDPSTEGDPPVSWTSEVTDSGPRWVCPACTREHVRSIEAKLDQQWW